MTIDIEEFLHQLPPEYQQRSTELLPAVQNIVSAWRRQIAQKANGELAGIDELVFTSMGTHPVYSDMAAVFSSAFEQLALRQPRLPNEIPLLFIGYHSMNRATGNRQSQGFLLTDQTLYVQDQSSVFFEQALPRFDALPSDPLLVLHFLATHFSRFAWEESMVKPAQRVELLQLLLETARLLLDHHNMRGSFVEAVKEAPSFDGLVRSLALLDDVKDGRKAEHAKVLANVSSKFQIPAGEKILFAMAVKPLFGGPYGFAVTRNNLYSRDLMEAPQVISFSELCAAGCLRLTEDKKNLVAPAGQVIFLPSHLRASAVERVATLIQGSVELIQAGLMTE